MISLQEDIVDLEDWVEISTLLDIPNLKNIQEERSSNTEQEIGESQGWGYALGIYWHRVVFIAWESRREYEDDRCESILYTMGSFYNYHF